MDNMRRRPEPVPFLKQIYDGQKGTVFGRDKQSWAKILAFYTIFYIVLGIFISIYLGWYLSTIPEHVPKYILQDSLIGTNPGLGYRPLPPEAQIDSTLIWFKVNDPETTRPWTNSLDEYLKEYRQRFNQGFQNCSFDHPATAKDKPCGVDVAQWSPCTRENNYNYLRGAPCVFLKLNKIYGWIPEYYNKSDDLPMNMPNELKQYIKSVEENEPAALNTVWISCEGENPADVENIGPVAFYPRRGFPGYYYPFTNDDEYVSPLVAVQIEKPKRGILINIECKAWARNIRHDRHDKIGMLHFELLVD